MKVFFDTEFIDDSSGLYLLSIGLVREDGKTYYAEVADVNYNLCGQWVREHVIPQFTGPVKNSQLIAFDIAEFCGPNPEFWAYFHAFDWVLLCRLFKGLVQVPKSWPHYCNDILVFKDQHSKWPMQKTPEHHALNDALWVKKVYESVKIK